jgi:hypothetical protein
MNDSELQIRLSYTGDFNLRRLHLNGVCHAATPGHGIPH